MKCKKLIPLLLSCLMLLEIPINAQAADFSSDSEISSDGSSQEQIVQNSLTLNLTHNTYNLNAQSSLQLTASILNTDESPLSVPVKLTWSSSQNDIASVSEQGVVTAHKAGTAVITATALAETENGVLSGSASCTITVANTLTLSDTNLTLYTGQTRQITADAKPAAPILWSSSDSELAEVDSEGNITPKKNGTVTITAVANGVSASCTVTIEKASLTLKQTKTVYLNNPITLKADAKPGGAVKWKSSNKKIAVVNASGKVTPKKTGKVTITATCNGLKKSCKVTVKKPSVKMKAQEITIFADNDYALRAEAHPASNLSYRSSDKKVVSVSKKGKILGLHSGTATITASVPGAKKSCKVTVIRNNYKLNRSSQTLMKGCSSDIYLSNASADTSVSFELSDDSLADLSVSGNSCKITARKSGSATLTARYSVYQNNQWISGEQSCTIKVVGSGVVQQQAAIAVKTRQKLSLKHVDKPDTTIVNTVWQSSDPNTVSVHPTTGTVTGKRTGSATITAIVSYADETSQEYKTNVKVSNPRTKYSRTVVSLGHTQKIALTGLTSNSTVTWKPGKSSLVTVSQDGTVTAGYTTGKSTVAIHVDGKTIKHTVYVTNPKLTTSYATIAPGKTTKIKLSGVSSQSQIRYRSKKKSVATVSKTGVVTAHSGGNADIIVTVDGNVFTFQVSVASQRAINACKTGYNIMYSSRYSQARRMSSGYYDCSSLVFRSYGCDTGLLGGIPSWAPTAASMASYMEKTGKVIAYRGISASSLRPGDLLFFRAPYSNGRYKNIYHVSMYYGGGYRLEKPLRYYYPERNLVMVARPVP
ncbi:Ig-like domain-containing protein [Lachnospiraceae bacterium 45-W7]